MDSEMYYVFRASGGEMPRTPHDSLESAMDEVRRLAKKEGRRNLFHVVKCVATVRVDLTMTETVHLEKTQVAESKYPRYFIGENWDPRDAYLRYDAPNMPSVVTVDGVQFISGGRNLDVHGPHESWIELPEQEALSRVTKKPQAAGSHESWRNEVVKLEEKQQVAEQIATKIAANGAILSEIQTRLSTDLVDPDEGTGSLLDMYRR